MDNIDLQNYKLFKSWQCNLDFEEVKNELLTLFKSPNPFLIYKNSQNIKDKFSAFLTCLAWKISDWFNISEDSKTFMFSIYKSSNYDKVWINELENYLRDSKNYDLLNYLFYVKTLNKDKQYLAKWLLKLYKWEQEKDIELFLRKYNAFVSLKTIKKIYDDFWLKDISLDINLREDFVEHFIEKIYLNLDFTKKQLFLDNFILRLDKSKIDFSDAAKILQKVINSYVPSDKIDQLNKTLENEYYTDVKITVDWLLQNYLAIRWSFYYEISDALKDLCSVDKASFWQYIKTYIIDNYYVEVKYLFYDYSSNVFLNKDKYSKIRWNLKFTPSISPEWQYLNSELNELVELKNIILELNNNLFSFFLLPVIYYTISEKLSIPKKDLYKMKYLLLYIFSTNYSEYKNIFMFFNQLEVFLNYDKKPKVLEKIQVSFSIFLMVFLFLILSYFFLPIWVFLWVFLYSCVKYFEVIHPNAYYSQKWNIWIKFFAIVFLSVSTYFWFQNFDKVMEKTEYISQRVEVLWTLPSKDVIDWSFRFLKANLFEIKQNHK